jgi:hypothetical protein
MSEKKLKGKEKNIFNLIVQGNDILLAKLSTLNQTITLIK